MTTCSHHPRDARIPTLSTTWLLFALAMSAWNCGDSETTTNEATAGTGGTAQGGSAGSAGANSAETAGANSGGGGSGGTEAAGGSSGSGGSGGAESNCVGDVGFVCCSADNSVLENAQCVENAYTCAPGMIRAASGVCEGTSEEQAEATGCFDAGGACVGLGQCGGSPASAHNSECVFDDGPGVCCLFPEPSEDGDLCSDYGGVCAPIGGCGRVVGYRIPTADCNQGPFMCCIPQSQCGAADVSCCAEGMTWYASASCVRGELVCAVPDTELMRTEDCEAIISQ